MKILYIASSDRWGGASVALFNLIQEIKKNNLVYVLLPDNKGRLYTELISSGVQCFVTSYSLTIYPKSRNLLKKIIGLVSMLYKKKKAELYILNLVKSINPDIVHNNVGPLDISLQPCKELGVKHVWHLREYQDLDFGMTFFPTKKKFKTKILDSNNYNIAITEGVFNYWNLRSNDTVIYDGVFSEQDTVCVEKEKYFLFVGRIQEAKGIHIAINAFIRFSRRISSYKLLIAGKFDEESAYYKLCHDLILNTQNDDSIIFLGEREDVYSLMSKATALIVPSRFEGFGFITAEAMLNDCLVIGHDVAGTKEQFDIGLKQRNAEIGMRFSSEDELFERLLQAVETDTSEMRANARAIVLSNYSSEIHAKNVIQYYYKILQK